jgi:predicted alpha/beta hydrolase
MGKIKITTTDGIELDANLFLPPQPKGVIQINGATAVPKEFYSNIAMYLFENNYAVLIFDYRGIGGSAPKEGLRNCTYEYVDWARKDMTAALAYLKNRFPDLPIMFLGHSVGGQSIGLIQNTAKTVKALVTINSSSGYHGGMTIKYHLRNFFFFEVVRPLTLGIWGYGKLKSFGFMEDLPKKIYNSWREWCSVPDYFFDPKYAPSIEGIGGYKNLDFPITVFRAADDDIATPINNHNLWKHIISSKPIEQITLEPRDYNLKVIGHFDLFRKKHKETLWPLVLEKLDNYLKK